jgi:hypothetical protein
MRLRIPGAERTNPIATFGWLSFAEIGGDSVGLADDDVGIAADEIGGSV